jgi:hypothetical protein
VLDTYLVLMPKIAFTCSESIATSFSFHLQLVGFTPNGIISELLFCFCSAIPAGLLASFQVLSMKQGMMHT